MPLIKIPRHYLVSQDEDSITVDVPESTLLHWKKDYEKITSEQPTKLSEFFRQSPLAESEELDLSRDRSLPRDAFSSTSSDRL